jgi:hypothetical protein
MAFVENRESRLASSPEAPDEALIRGELEDLPRRAENGGLGLG